MNLIGYKFFDKARTRRSSEILTMDEHESADQFRIRCSKMGFEPTDPRNITDHYKNMEDDLIRGDLNSRRFNFSILLQNVYGDYNKAVCIRNNNAFCGEKVILYGKKKYDRRGTVGTHVYENLVHVESSEQSIRQIRKDFDRIICIDNVESAVAIDEFTFNTKEKTLFVLGEEGVGVCGEFLEICDNILYIKQFGSVRSLNVSCACAIAMYEYTKQATF